jgi:hypothetical protein
VSIKEERGKSEEQRGESRELKVEIPFMPFSPFAPLMPFEAKKEE